VQVTSNVSTHAFDLQQLCDAITPKTLAQAEREASRVYSRTGIETEWLDCPLTPSEAEHYPACQLPMSPARVAIRVLYRNMSERLGLTATTFGSALLSADGGLV